jgi:outer membrane protein
MKLNLILIVTLVLYSFSVKAQSNLSLNQAIQTAVQNNLDIKIVVNENKIVQNNNHSGNAGMLPNVALNANASPSLTNINQKFTNGTSIEKNGVLSNSLSANVIAVWTLYDGSKMFALKNQLNAQETASYQFLKSNVLKTVSNVISAYSNIVKQVEYSKVLNQLKVLSEERLNLIQQKLTAGLSNNTELYLAQLDFETVKQNITAQNALITNAYVDLNLLLNFPSDSTYKVEAFETSNFNFNKSNLDSMLVQNPDYEYSLQQLAIAKESARIVHSASLPNVRISGAYNYNFSQSQAGFSLFNQTTGPQVGLTLSVPLFTGNVNSVNYKNAQIQVDNQNLMVQKIHNELKGLLDQAWANYSSLQTQLASDSIAVETAKSYIDLMQKRFSLGQNTIIELKEAQRTYENTYYRYINNLYMNKLTETQLLVLTGQLVN